MIIDMDTIIGIAIFGASLALVLVLMVPILEILYDLIDSVDDIPCGWERTILAILAGIKAFALLSAFFFVVFVPLDALYKAVGLS